MAKLSTRMLPQRATISRLTRASDGRGGYPETLEPVAEKVPCRLAGASLRPYSGIDGQLSAEITRSLYVMPEVDIRAQDVIAVAGVSARLVVQAADPQADGAYRKCLVTEEQPDNLVSE